MTWREEWEELTGKCAPNCSLTQNRFHPVVLAMDRHVREVEDELSRAEQHAKKMAEEYNVLAKKYHEQRGRAEQAEAQLCRVKKVLTELAHHWPKGNVYEVAIKDTAPCPHEAEVKRLRAAIDWVLESDECYALDYEDMVAELRRRAEGGK